MNLDKIHLEFANSKHAETIQRIFQGKNMGIYSPVEDISLEELKVRLDSGPKSFQDFSPFYRIMASYEGKVFGTFILKSIDYNKLTAEIGYGILDEFQNKKLGKAMVEKCMKFVLISTPLLKIWAKVHEENYASIKILEYLEFSEIKNQYWVSESSKLQKMFEFHKTNWDFPS